MLADGKTILICTDFSKHSEDAIEWAVNSMTVAGDRLLVGFSFEVGEKEDEIWAVLRTENGNKRARLENHLLYYVIQEPGTAPGSKPTPIDDDIGMVVNDSTTPVKTSQIHEARDAMNLTMEKVGKMVQGMEGVTVEGLIEFGNAGENVCHKAKAIRAKFVVVGTRGTSSTWRGLMMGSTSHYLLLNCPTPVIISRGPKSGVSPSNPEEQGKGLGLSIPKA